ncbi:PREDICTED: protein FAM166A [Chaetura pelagica]|uniref:protein FAM166A n=1 Tax=Chaetura pelagica TaxID=8897 RepID=UPI000523771E|nr:PREDICTED: protein FAM166A [Chaetura pelagica]
MAGPKENGLFPPNPYHIPGYEGFIPQYNYRFGETFGRTTHRLLTDPEVVRSPRSLLAPVHKQKFIEDFSGTHSAVQRYLPGQPAPFPYEHPGAVTNFPEPDHGPNPALLGPRPEEKDRRLMTDLDPRAQQHPAQYTPGARLPPRTPWHPCSGGHFLETSPACGQGPGAPVGSKLPVRTGGVTLPERARAVDEEDGWLPTLEVPRAIQQKVITGYAGFIPRIIWFPGLNYVQSVKEAMKEFDQLQFMERNPAGTFGKRFPKTYWPNNKIYTSSGLIPCYSGFVPALRHTYALTFGNSTRKAYQNEQRRRAGAL